MSPQLPDLPVTAVLESLRAALRDPGRAVLVAPPGAGKTTVVPLALLGEPWLGDRKVVVLEPRRLAARAAARRMAELLGEEDAGGTVGYRVRLDTRVGPRTRVEVVTEGVLTRMLQSDPALEDVGLVVFDEFHERSLHADLGLALTLQSRALLRRDLRLLVMSATLEAGPVAELLRPGATGATGATGVTGAPPSDPPTPVISSEGRRHPVETRYRARPVEGWIEPAVVRAVQGALERDPGDLLVFLPGAGEIRRTASRLESAGLPPGVELHPLFGNLPRAEQDRAIRPSAPGRRKVVLATSIAETSLTIEGVRVVVDAGLMRVPRFDSGTGMTRLETVRVTRDAADQRRGRAGRTAPGVCYRLWTRAEDRGLMPRRRPEVLEADLAPLVLELAAWGAEAGELSWLDAPPRAALAQARELLGELDAVDGEGAVTEHGRLMAELGAHPRLAHMLLRGREMGLGGAACDLAALLGGRDVLRGEGSAPDADLRLRMDALRRAWDGGVGRVGSVGGQRVDRAGLARVLREAGHWRRRLGSPRDGGGGSRGRGGAGGETGVLCALAYPDRVGRRREGQRGRFLLRNGRGAHFPEIQSLSQADWLVTAAVEGRGADARIFLAAPLTREDVETLFGHQVREVASVEWDAEARRARAHRRRMLGELVLSEAPVGDPDPGRIRQVLMGAVREAGLQVLPWTRETTQLRHRLEFLHRLDPEAWPPTSEPALEEGLSDWLVPFLTGMKGFDDLRRLDLAEALLARVGWERRARVEALAPTHMEVPSGSRIAVDYSDPDAPALAVRLQEVFGLTETPRVGGGGVPLTMKLLSPAHRPVQVTTDLASFWRDAYFEVRRELRGRYPKHPWPEDPLAAQPTRRTKRRS